MDKKKEGEKARKEGEKMGDDYLPTILITAGTAVLVAAFVKRAVMLFLVEQWRVWVFLILNLILLAIFFTSTPSENQVRHGNGEAKVSKSRKCDPGLPVKVEENEITCHGVCIGTGRRGAAEEEKDGLVEEEEEEEEAPRLSMEELNERVEAFIFMFKQQLVSDAKKGGNQHERAKKPELLKFQRSPK